MTARERGSVTGWLCAPVRLIDVCLTETCGRFLRHRNNVDRTPVQHRRLQNMLLLIRTDIATRPGHPVRGDDPIRNT